MEKEVKRNRKNICCFSSRMVNKEILQDKPQKRVKPVLKSLVELIIERSQKNPCKVWTNNKGEVCMMSMNTVKGFAI